MKALFDSNILIDVLKDHPQASVAIKSVPDRAISIMTWMELMSGTNEENEQSIRQFLRGFLIVPLNDDVVERAFRIRKRDRIKLPDAVILASAQSTNRVLVTRNTRDFDAKSRDIRVPYKI